MLYRVRMGDMLLLNDCKKEIAITSLVEKERKRITSYDLSIVDTLRYPGAASCIIERPITILNSSMLQGHIQKNFLDEMERNTNVGYAKYTYKDGIIREFVEDVDGIVFMNYYIRFDDMMDGEVCLYYRQSSRCFTDNFNITDWGQEITAQEVIDKVHEWVERILNYEFKRELVK